MSMIALLLAALAAPAPIAAPYDAWTFVPFPEARCAPGTSTGIGINPHKGSKRLLVYLRGGGICWNREGCVEKERSTYVLTGYGPKEFDGERTGQLAKPSYFARDDQKNLFHDWSWVYVPYCTGDLHMGARVHDYDGTRVHHVGFANMTAYLRRLVATFPDVEQVVLTGGSAGGFGSAWNFEQVRRAFAKAARGVQLIDDSGPYLPAPYFTRPLQVMLDDHYGASANVPGCGSCDPRMPGGGFDRIYAHLATTPGFRGSLVSSVQDFSIGGRLSETPGDSALVCPRQGPAAECRFFTEGLYRLADDLSHLRGPGQMKVFLVPGNGHVWMGAAPGRVVSAGVALSDFVRKQVTGDPSWQSVRPTP
jgi:hypothetical protein